MEERVLTLELAVEQNTKLGERLDRSMAQLTQAMADLRVQMGQGFADLRQEMVQGHADLRQEMALIQVELRKEMATDYEKLQNKIATVQAESRQEMIMGFAEVRKYVDHKFFWLLSAYFSTLVAVLGFLVKYFIDVYAK